MSLSQIIALSCIEIVGDFGLKVFSTKGGIVPLMFGIGGYIGVVIMLIISLKHSTILLVNGGWDGISALINSVAAYVILGERFQDPIQYVGLVFIIIGLYFLKIPNDNGFIKN